jgi:hypothetical protein
MSGANHLDGALERHALGIRDMRAVVGAIKGSSGAAFSFLGGELEGMER